LVDVGVDTPDLVSHGEDGEATELAGISGHHTYYPITVLPLKCLSNTYISFTVFTVNIIYLKYGEIMMPRMRKKTSISVDENLWREWISFVANKTGSARKISEELEKAMREYMERHGSHDKKVLNGLM